MRAAIWYPPHRVAVDSREIMMLILTMWMCRVKKVFVYIVSRSESRSHWPIRSTRLSIYAIITAMSLINNWGRFSPHINYGRNKKEKKFVLTATIYMNDNGREYQIFSFDIITFYDCFNFGSIRLFASCCDEDFLSWLIKKLHFWRESFPTESVWLRQRRKGIACDLCAIIKTCYDKFTFLLCCFLYA